jgi:hypothetical protein
MSTQQIMHIPMSYFSPHYKLKKMPYTVVHSLPEKIFFFLVSLFDRSTAVAMHLLHSVSPQTTNLYRYRSSSVHFSLMSELSPSETASREIFPKTCPKHKQITNTHACAAILPAAATRDQTAMIHLRRRRRPKERGRKERRTKRTKGQEVSQAAKIGAWLRLGQRQGGGQGRQGAGLWREECIHEL